MHKMNKFRNLFNLVVSESIGNEKQRVGLLFSGGVDSLSCGFAAEDLGHTVVAYTFKIDGIDSVDSFNAEKCADSLGWEYILVNVPLDNLKTDFLSLASDWKCEKKTQYECTWPFLYLVPRIQENIVLSGIAADGHYGLSKRAVINFKEPKSLFDQFRIEYFSSKNPAGQIQQKLLLEKHGITQVAPYLDVRIFNYFLKFDWFQINKPREKEIILSAYPEYFSKVPIRKHANLQIVSGVREVFETLLDTDLNINKRSRVMDLCRDYTQKYKSKQHRFIK